jgi:parallel beta-helix repeat protein
MVAKFSCVSHKLYKESNKYLKEMNIEKTGILWVYILVVLLSFPSGVGFILEDQHPLSKNILTVDDEGDGDFVSIKDALAHALPGDTIEVYSGTYEEYNITITVDRILLIGMPYELGNGSDIGKPFINGKGVDHVLIIKACNVIVSGFHIENFRVNSDCDIIVIYRDADNCTISDNILRYSSNSNLLCNSNFSKITDNIITDAGFRYGIILGNGHTTISGNVIDNCPTGICFWGGSNTTVLRNRISNCSEFGVDIGGGGLNTFQFNTFENNYVGLHIYMSVLNKINQNNFINNTYQAGYNLGLSLMAGNRFFRNYWDRPRLLPYPIKGSVLLIVPWVSFDWRPAQEPYDIS